MVVDNSVFRELRGLYDRLEGERLLLSESRLTSYDENFRKRFGPDMLATLEGEDLVETMHSHANKESLVYSWLLALDILQPYCNQASTG